jgi:hypothetical protein
MKKARSASGDSAIDLLEEAVHLLRGTPVTLYGIYAVGTLPFVLAFLYFWADMSHGAFAGEHIDRAAATMGLLFLWMKCWQAIFATELRWQRTGQTRISWTARRVGSLALKQISLQPSGLFAIPLALFIMIPFAWVFAFYQNLTALGAEPGSIRDTWNAAARQTAVRSSQNHLVQGLLFVFAFFVWLNVATAMAWLPSLLKMLFGIETAFTQAGMKSVFNTTFLACSFALAYIFVDPLVKAVFVLRCFYGQSLETGDDIKSDLASIRSTASSALPVLAALFILVANPVMGAPSAGANAPTTAVSPTDLDRSIDEVLQRPEFAWRMPREAVKEVDSKQTTWLGRAVGAVVDTLRDLAKYCLKSLGKLVKWFMEMARKLWPEASQKSDTSGLASGWTSFLQTVLFVLIIVIAALLSVLIFRMWLRRRKPHPVVTTAIVVKPDLNDENVAADQLPEDGWLKMAQEMIAQGNLRLALRAFYLAGLASLAAREMLAIASFKSNREYERELRRRARIQPTVQIAFSQNVMAFDRAWYGLHEVTPETLQQFQMNLEQIRAC